MMTRTEIQRRELAEAERHNKEQERAAIYGAAANAVGSIGSLMRGTGSVVGAFKQGTHRPASNNATHYHFHEGNGRYRRGR